MLAFSFFLIPPPPPIPSLLSTPACSSLVSEEGETKDDLQLPTYPDGFGQEIKNQFEDGKTLVRAETRKDQTRDAQTVFLFFDAAVAIVHVVVG